MLPADLPFEIIACIARLLSIQDKYTCTFVCSGWKTPFQENLWNVLYVSDKKRLLSICGRPLKRQIAYQRHGKHVVELTLSKKLKATDDQLYLIQNSFKNVQRLWIESRSLSKVNFGSKSDWKIWEALTTLRINLDKRDIFYAELKLLDILSCLPRLQHLDISQTAQRKRMVFTLEIFELLHFYLPDLKSLSINVDFCVPSTEDLERIANVTPAYNPSVHTLRWEVYGNGSLSDDHQDEAASLFASLPYAFPHLKTVDIFGSMYSEKVYSVLCELLNSFNIPIKNLRHEYKFSPDRPKLLKQLIRGYTNSSSNTLETLFIKSSLTFLNYQNITASFYHCPRLVELTLDRCFASIVLDVLLYRCPGLKILRISSGKLLIGRNASKTSPKHGLRLIDIRYALVTPAALNYLSFRCRSLNYMRLSRVDIQGSFSQRDGRILLDMSYTHLKVLILEAVIFLPDNIWIISNIINLINLIAPTASQPSVGHSCAPSVVSDTMEKKTESTWIYRICEKDTDDDCSYGTRKLNKKESKYADKYYRNFQRNRNIPSKTNPPRNYTGPADSHDWKRNLLRGHVELRCGYIGVYFISPTASSQSKFWDKSLDDLD
ncbi:hypothetical protein J3Q64DRAFT_1769134 [Phycomyces blakesleeanus]|uniref:F-box domain-containing protein n=1 Tax=Phycomyces blakesleeanus TaxID=4837 RepID=A0ABR3ALQ9_PHYBL